MSQLIAIKPASGTCYKCNSDNAVYESLGERWCRFCADEYLSHHTWEMCKPSDNLQKIQEEIDEFASRSIPTEDLPYCYHI